MISTTSEYALRAVIYIAQRDQDEPIRASEISDGVGMPANYTSKILHTLARAGILTSERGPRGGFRLAGSPADLPLADVIEPFDALGERRTCLLGRPQCSDRTPCAVHHRWKTAYEPVLEFFNETTVSDLLSSSKSSSTMADTGGTDDGAS